MYGTKAPIACIEYIQSTNQLCLIRTVWTADGRLDPDRRLDVRTGSDKETRPMGKSCLAMSVLAAISLSARSGATEEAPAVRDGGVLIDVRTAREFKGGHLDKAINIPHGEIGDKIGSVVTNKGEKIVLYCSSGNRSGIAEGTLRAMGYTNVVNAGAYSRMKEKEAKAGPATAPDRDRKADGQSRKTE